MPLKRFHQRFVATMALCIALLSPGASAAPDIVVSIKPLELLVRSVATGDTRVTTLVPPGTNPHSFSMKPSQRHALAEADAIFWIGPDMETFLRKLLSGAEFRSRSHALGTESDVDSDHSDDGHTHDHHGHDDQNDPHIWLDPTLARDMARRITQTLAQLPNSDPEALNANLARFESRLTTTEADIHKQLEPARSLSLFTYHNAFSHFAGHYDLRLAGVLALNPEVSPGARHVAQVQDRLRGANRPCVMPEKPFNPEAWQTILGDSKVTFSPWDPLASDIEPGPDSYLQLQTSIADAVLGCL